MLANTYIIHLQSEDPRPASLSICHPIIHFETTLRLPYLIMVFPRRKARVLTYRPPHLKGHCHETLSSITQTPQISITLNRDPSHLRKKCQEFLEMDVLQRMGGSWEAQWSYLFVFFSSDGLTKYQGKQAADIFCFRTTSARMTRSQCTDRFKPRSPQLLIRPKDQKIFLHSEIGRYLQGTVHHDRKKKSSKDCVRAVSLDLHHKDLTFLPILQKPGDIGD